MITDLPINKAYLSAITVTNISQSIYLQDGGKNQLARQWVSEFEFQRAVSYWCSVVTIKER